MTTSQKWKRLKFIDIAINQTIYTFRREGTRYAFTSRNIIFLPPPPSPSLAEKILHSSGICRPHVHICFSSECSFEPLLLSETTNKACIHVVVEKGQNRGCVSEELLLRPLSGYNMSTHDQNRSICPILNLCWCFYNCIFRLLHRIAKHSNRWTG